MHLYRGSTSVFVEDVHNSQIASKLQDEFRHHFGYSPGDGEVRSWQNSLRSMASVIDHADLYDHGIAVEYRLPLSSKRLDCMITGESPSGSASAVIIELKQWDEVEPSETDECVTTYVGRGKRTVLHPSRQVGNYQRYLLDAHTAFTDNGIDLRACSYLHNMQPDKALPLLDESFASLIQRFPLFIGTETDGLEEFLENALRGGNGGPILERVLTGKYRPAKRLLREAARIIDARKDEGEFGFALLDEQQVVMNEVLTKIRLHQLGDYKTVVIVRGGPGTGKSAIAVNLLGELARQGYVAQHATGSKAFTENLRRAVGTRVATQFSYFNNFGKVDDGSIDVLICDEAHRIRETSATRFTKKADRDDRKQIDELIDAAKIAVFFIDDRQIVRPGEAGSTTLIRSAAQAKGCRVIEHELEAQFRCGGSDAYLRWIDNTLDLQRGEPAIWDDTEGFDIEIVDDIHELEAAIRTCADEGQAARLVAGYCWPWSNPIEDGTLVADVKIGDWSRPWNARPEARLAKGIPKSNFWASDPNGLEQVGCVYTAQGFEFDRVGVIWGRDLVYRARQGWVGQPEHSKDSMVLKAKKDPAHFTALLKNTYRVLLSRGMSGCSIYAEDEETRNFLLSRIRLR